MESPYATTWYVWVAPGLVIFHEVFWVMVFAFALPLSATASDAMTPKARTSCLVINSPPEKGAYRKSGSPEKPPCTASLLFTALHGTRPGPPGAARAGPWPRRWTGAGSGSARRAARGAGGGGGARPPRPTRAWRSGRSSARRG